MFFEYPSFKLSVESQGSTAMGYLFTITVESSSASTTTMMLIGPPPGGHLHSVPPAASFAAAAHKVVQDLRMLLSEGVDKVVDARMRLERRVLRRDLEEATELAMEALEVAQSVDERDLVQAERDIARRIDQGGIRRTKPRIGMGTSEQARTAGARQLESHGFTEIHEIALVGKGRGLWYEAKEPPPSWKTPHDWTPRGEPGEHVLLLRQAPNIWHAFYKTPTTGSGGDPRRALTGGLGDAIGTDAEMERYCDLVLAAPRRLAEDYSGLYEAQGQCFHDRQEAS
jgi:hypothetical protein